MKVNAGLWIDHKRALIVITFPGGEKKLELRSHLEARPAGAGTPGADLAGASATLLRYYLEVIQAIRDAESILIFGPGEAKFDLRNQLERARLSHKVSSVEWVGQITDLEIAAKVREHFQWLKVQGTSIPGRKLDAPVRIPSGSPAVCVGSGARR